MTNAANIRACDCDGQGVAVCTCEKASAASKHRRKPTRAKQLGVSDEEYERRLAAQGGRCAIPGCPRTPKTRRFHVDHDHATGYVRGLLCHWHNRIMPRDSQEAAALAAYLLDSERAQAQR